jgi:hypothetical protein
MGRISLVGAPVVLPSPLLVHLSSVSWCSRRVVNILDALLRGRCEGAGSRISGKPTLTLTGQHHKQAAEHIRARHNLDYHHRQSNSYHLAVLEDSHMLVSTFPNLTEYEYA